MSPTHPTLVHTGLSPHPQVFVSFTVNPRHLSLLTSYYKSLLSPTHSVFFLLDSLPWLFSWFSSAVCPPNCPISCQTSLSGVQIVSLPSGLYFIACKQAGLIRCLKRKNVKTPAGFILIEADDTFGLHYGRIANEKAKVQTQNRSGRRLNVDISPPFIHNLQPFYLPIRLYQFGIEYPAIFSNVKSEFCRRLHVNWEAK